MDSTILFYVHPNYFNQKIISLIDERLSMNNILYWSDASELLKIHF